MNPNFSHIKTHTIRDKSFRMVWKKPRNTCPDPKKHTVGQCDNPNTPGKALWLWPGQDAEELLFTTFHECTHAAFPDIDEAAVTALEQDVARLLKRMGLKVAFDPKKT